MAWRLFNWGSRGPHYDAGLGVYVATILIPQAAQISLFGHTQDGALLMHSFHVRAPHTPVTLSDVTDIAGNVASWAATAPGLKSLVNELVSIDRVVVTAIDVLEGPQHEIGINVGGTRTGNPTPNEVCLALKKAGVNRGRSRRGRFYTWPMVTSDISTTNGNSFGGTYRSECLTVYNALLTDLTGGGSPLCIASFRHGVLYDVNAIISTDELVDHQDRRAGGRGR